MSLVMGAASPATQLVVDLTGWPGIVLDVAPDGVVRASNGHLDRLLGATVVGRPLAELLDDESSGGKWTRLSAPSSTPADAGAIWELMFCTPTRILDPRRFTVTRAPDDGGVCLVEHPVNPLVARVENEIAQVNSELAGAQRALVKEQRQLAHALRDVRRSNEALDEFAHAVSHDLKAPLRAIIEYSELLTEQVAPQLDEENAAYVRRIAALSVRMRTMIDSVLQYAQAGRTSRRVDRIDSGETLREIVEFLAPPPDVRVELEPGLPVFHGARVPFEQVFRNLISNAIKYRGETDAWVRVTAARNGGCWELVVADNGRGIPPARQERIWRLFDTSDPEHGTGIGLALVKRLVESEGGQVRVESETGRGSRFHVLWPAGQPDDPERAT